MDLEFTSESFDWMSRDSRRLEDKALKELGRAEDLIVNGILANASELVDTLAKSFSTSEGTQQALSNLAELENQTQENSETENAPKKNFDIQFAKLSQVGDEYLDAVKNVTEIIIEHIPQLSPFVEVRKTNYGLKKELELIDEKIIQIQNFIQQIEN